MAERLKLILDPSVTGTTAKWQPENETLPGLPKAGSWPAYRLDDDLLRLRSKEVTQALAALINVGWTYNLGDARAVAAGQDYSDAMRRLASAGMKLFNVLASGNEDDQKSVRIADSFRAWFFEHVADSGEGAFEIEVLYTDTPVNEGTRRAEVWPWGLMFTPLSEEAFAALDPTDPSSFNRFWCQRYALAVRSGSQTSTGLTPRRGDNVRIRVVLEGKAYNTVETSRVAARANSRGRAGGLGDFATQQEFFALNKREYDQLQRESIYAREDDVFLYISLQSQRDASERGGVDAPAVKQMTKSGDKMMLILLDGDAVIRGDRGVSWLETVMQLGENGLIAVEADITNPVLKFYGWKILREVMEVREPLVQAIRKVRVANWPLGLLYGLYCNPLHVYVDPPPKNDIERIQEHMNFLRDEL